jgi:hypothetical protein
VQSEPIHDVDTVELVTGIIEDTRELVGVHVEALRDDLSVRVAALGATLTSLVIAVAVFVVMAVLLDLSVPVSLAELGMPWWLALWIVSIAVGAIGVWFGLRARTKAHEITKENP